MRVRVFKVSGKDLFVLRNGDYFIASFSWGMLLDKFLARKFKPMGSTLRMRFGMTCQ